jgi:hypothetical protein
MTPMLRPFFGQALDASVTSRDNQRRPPRSSRMPSNRDSKRDGGRDRDGGKVSPHTLGHLHDDTIAKSLLGPESRTTREKPWWAMLISWFNIRPSNE